MVLIQVYIYLCLFFYLFLHFEVMGVYFITKADKAARRDAGYDKNPALAKAYRSKT